MYLLEVESRLVMICKKCTFLMKYVHLWMNRGSDHRSDPFWQNTFPKYFPFNVRENYLLYFLTPPPHWFQQLWRFLVVHRLFGIELHFALTFILPLFWRDFCICFSFILFRSFKKVKMEHSRKLGARDMHPFFFLTPPVRCKIPNKSEQVKLKSKHWRGIFWN